MGRVAMGFWALLVLGDWNMLEGAVLSEKAFSVGAAVEAEEDRLSDKASKFTPSPFTPGLDVRL